MQSISQARKNVKLSFENKAIFFDRDGVINKLVNRDNGLFSPRKVEEFTLFPDIKKCINICSQKNLLVIIISNQPDISRGKMNIKDLEEINRYMKSELSIDDIYYAFDDIYTKNGLKKPSPNMVFNAKKKWKINLEKSLFIGDSQVDIDCAKNAGVDFVLIRRDHNKDLKSSKMITDLTEITKFFK